MIVLPVFSNNSCHLGRVARIGDEQPAVSTNSLKKTFVRGTIWERVLHRFRLNPNQRLPVVCRCASWSVSGNAWDRPGRAKRLVIRVHPTPASETTAFVMRLVIIPNSVPTDFITLRIMYNHLQSSASIFSGGSKRTWFHGPDVQHREYPWAQPDGFLAPLRREIAVLSEAALESGPPLTGSDVLYRKHVPEYVGCRIHERPGDR